MKDGTGLLKAIESKILYCKNNFFSGMNRKTLRIWFYCLTGELYSRYTGSGIFLSGDVQLYASQGKRSRKL